MGSPRTRLAAVPRSAPRVLGLVRVSMERDGMISPEVQRVAIEDAAARRGYVIAGWMEGLDESGSQKRSAWWPRLDQAVAAVEAGEYDVVLVWKFSRVARHRLRWAVAIDRVEEAGGRIESATEDVDTTTSTGRFTRGMLAELQAFEAERIGEVWSSVHDARIRSGRPHTGKPKWGYLYAREQKLHVPDPETGPVLADLYRRYVAGESVYALVRWLNAHGWRTLEGGVWADRTLRRVLDSGFAAGLFMAGGNPKKKVKARLHQGVHEPLIDGALWQAYLDARETRRARPARAERSQYLLSGLVRCARCERPMVAGQFGEARAPKYRCKTGKEQGPEGCRGGYVMAAFLERELLAWLRDLAGDVDGSRARRAEATAVRRVQASEEKRLARALGQVDTQLKRLAMQNVTTPLPAAVYRETYDDLMGQREQLEQALADVGRERRAGIADPARHAAALLEEWDEKPVEHRREALRRLLRYLDVTTGRPRATVRVVPTWEPREGP